MSDLNGTPGELRFVLTVTRKDTGQVEHVEMVGKVTPDSPQPETKEENNVPIA